MAHPDRAFSETEKVNLLAEIIKTSPVPHTALLDLIYDFRVEPQWLEVARPPGRSPQECQAAFDQLRAAHPPAAARPPTASFQPPPQQFINRPFAPVEGLTSIGGSRMIQPRPEGVPHSAYPSAGSPYTLQGSEPSFKKRGRPSNAAVELRNRLAAERGEELPPTRSRKRSKNTASGAPTSPSSSTAAGGGQPSVEANSGTGSQRASFPGYQEPSPSSVGPTRRSPGTMEPPVTDQRPSMQPPFSHHERSYSQPHHLPPPQTPHHTPTQSHPPPREQPVHHQPRLPSPQPYHRPLSMSMHGPVLPRPTGSPRVGTAPPPLSSSQSIFQRPTESPHHRAPPEVSSGEPMEH